MLEESIIKQVLEFQKNEISEYFIYKNLSKSEKDPHNKKILSLIADDELRHYNIWKSYTNREIAPDKYMILKFVFISKIFGVTFSIKLMESGEERAQKNYEKIEKDIPETEKIKHDENEHENELIQMIDEDRLKYIGSVVLGLNDALVELTGTLAGLTFALQNSKLIGMAGLITGIAASLSMAASEYLSTKSEAGAKNPLKASLYTGIAYVVAVSVLITPFLLLSNYYYSLMFAIFGAIILIFVFTFYFSVIKGISFKSRFLEMAGISLGVALISFLIGLAVREFIGIDL